MKSNKDIKYILNYLGIKHGICSGMYPDLYINAGNPKQAYLLLPYRNGQYEPYSDKLFLWELIDIICSIK